ncbi:aminodeoxychorismate synthase component I [Longimicrobium sp.]|uniref:aminodeoxychorismate synthase component I n=1 Tax=Longimicrobium sp. TaxID=2029185 RepID=UPI002E35FF65|nr:aminodeoxychorismate synthase component I [Longimicrobium sp.]HEX6039244.1 aminodeoxychorismate synthase component I [Longimicrobium sp.]
MTDAVADTLQDAFTEREPAAVRFDAPGGGRSFRFRGPRGVLRADRVEDVLPLLRAVERAVADGLHAAGFVAYEAAPAFDPAFVTHPPDPRLPLAWFALYEAREAVRPEYESAPLGDADLGPWRIDLDEAAYTSRIDRIREWIAAGDTYQVNLTTRLTASFDGDPRILYERLCLGQRSDFCAFVDLGEGRTIVSASPELFFRLDGDGLELRPMKGTRPRGRWPEEDRALAAELAASPKDRAENLMIVDLLRNDAGRVARTGGVRVERMFDVERYETVHQMTSTIRAVPRPDAGLADVFRALFPCGSVTGAPKVRTMEIIRDVETAPRGAYCGAIGFASPGEAVFSVGIRTLLLDAAAGTAELGIGSGVTYDSDAAAEYRECWSKAAFARRAPADFDLLETLLWEPDGGWFLLDGHLARLAASAAYFGYRYDEGVIRAGLADFAHVASAHSLRVRLTLDRGGCAEIESAPLQASAEPVRVAVSADPVDSRDPLLYHKTTRRDAYTRRAADRPDCDDVLLVNERGELTESTIANLVVRMDGALWTPPLDSGLLPGVFRAELLARGEIRERVLRVEDLADAEEIWLINSVRRWRRAELVD